VKKITSSASVTASITVTFPKNTTTPIQFTNEVACKMLTELTVIIPSGHKGLAGLQISVPSAQLVPAAGSSDSFVFGDDKEITVAPGIELMGPPYSIRLKGYNNDTFLDHSFTIRVTTK
jgi:hypothetical protein